MGEEGEATLRKSFMESFESGGGRNRRLPIATRGEERDEVGKKE
jgi:hypothetical protein